MQPQVMMWPHIINVASNLTDTASDFKEQNQHSYLTDCLKLEGDVLMKMCVPQLRQKQANLRQRIFGWLT